MRRLVPFVLLWACLARAHDADVVYVNVQRGASPDLLALTATLTPASLALLAPLDADDDGELSQGDLDARVKAIRLGFWEDAPLTAGGRPCELLETWSALKEGFVELHADARCGEGELRQDFKILRVLPANYRVVLGSQLEGESRGRAFAQGSLSAVTIPRPVPEGSWDPARFESAFLAGQRRAQTPEVILAVCALLVAVGTWRRGLGFVAVTGGVAALACGVPLPWMPASAMLVLVALGAAMLRPTPWFLPVLLGFAIGAREGGGGWVTWLGLAVPTVLVIFAIGAVPLALGAVLARRPTWHAGLRWGLLVAVAGAVLVQARLSW